MDGAAAQGDVFVTATGNIDVITIDHMRRHMKDRAIVCKIGHFDSEIQIEALRCATGNPSFVMSASFTNQVLAQIEPWTNYGKYDNKVYVLPKHLDEKVVALNLD